MCASLRRLQNMVFRKPSFSSHKNCKSEWSQKQLDLRRVNKDKKNTKMFFANKNVSQAWKRKPPKKTWPNCRTAFVILIFFSEPCKADIDIYWGGGLCRSVMCYDTPMLTPGCTTGYYKSKFIRSKFRRVLGGTTSTPKYPSKFGPNISNVQGFHYKNKPAQVVPWHFLSLEKYRFVFFGPLLAK